MAETAKVNGIPTGIATIEIPELQVADAKLKEVQKVNGKPNGNINEKKEGKQ